MNITNSPTILQSENFPPNLKWKFRLGSLESEAMIQSTQGHQILQAANGQQVILQTIGSPATRPQQAIQVR